jgi:hypothetical protein
VCENRILRRIYGPRRSGIKVRWKNLHYTAWRHNLLFFANNCDHIKEEELGRKSGSNGGDNDVKKILAGKSEGKVEREIRR